MVCQPLGFRSLNRAKSPTVPKIKLLANTKAVQVITAKSPKGAIIKTIQVIPALARAMNRVR